MYALENPTESSISRKPSEGRRTAVEDTKWPRGTGALFACTITFSDQALSISASGVKVFSISCEERVTDEMEDGVEEGKRRSRESGKNLTLPITQESSIIERYVA